MGEIENIIHDMCQVRRGKPGPEPGQIAKSHGCCWPVCVWVSSIYPKSEDDHCVCVRVRACVGVALIRGQRGSTFNFHGHDYKRHEAKTHTIADNRASGWVLGEDSITATPTGSDRRPRYSSSPMNEWNVDPAAGQLRTSDGGPASCKLHFNRLCLILSRQTLSPSCGRVALSWISYRVYVPSTNHDV